MKGLPGLWIRGAQVFAPEPLGVRDILTAGETIVAMGPLSCSALPHWLELTVVDAAGLTAVPGLVDGHVHLAGGGGEGGFRFRTPPATAEGLLSAGITTAVGLLGTDGTTRSVQALLAQASALEAEGLRTWVYTGAYQLPMRTVTASAREDIILIDKVIGIGEVAVSDHRGSHPSPRQLAELAGEARVGGLLADKAGILHLHVGPGPRGLASLFALLRLGDIPVDTLLPTHLNRSRELLGQAAEWARRGGRIDLTAGIAPDPSDPQAVGAADALAWCLAQGVPLERISISSDAYGSAPVFDSGGHLLAQGVGSPVALWQTVVRLRQAIGLDWPAALAPVTVNPARALKLSRWGIGRLVVGGPADMLLVNGGDIVGVVVRGRLWQWRARRRGRPQAPVERQARRPARLARGRAAVALTGETPPLYNVRVS